MKKLHHILRAEFIVWVNTLVYFHNNPNTNAL